MPRLIKDMRNLGPVMQRHLAKIDVVSEADLRRLGAVEAFRRLKFILGHQISLNALYAMEASLCDCDWRMLEEATKQRLKKQVNTR